MPQWEHVPLIERSAEDVRFSPPAWPGYRHDAHWSANGPKFPQCRVYRLKSRAGLTRVALERSRCFIPAAVVWYAQWNGRHGIPGALSLIRIPTQFHV